MAKLIDKIIFTLKKVMKGIKYIGYFPKVSIKNIKKGEAFTRDNIWVKRPGTGEIAAEDYQNILGKVSLVDIQCDKHIKWSEINE
jgi:sialic acid synthase SpsE